MGRFALRVILSALAVLAAGTVFPEWISVRSGESALIFAFVLGLLHAALRPVFSLLALPLTLVTLGLSTVLVNVAIFWLATQVPTGVQAEGLVGVLLGSLTVSLTNLISGQLSR